MGVLIAVVVVIALSLGSEEFGLAWDESIYFPAANSIRLWFHLGCPMDISSLQAGWMDSPIHLPHPAMSRIFSALSAEAFGSILGFPLCYRFIHYLLIGGATGVSYFLLAKRIGPTNALILPALTILQPRIFGHSIMGTTDGPVAHLGLAITLLGLDILDSGASRWKWLLLLSLATISATMKLSGLFALPALILWLLPGGQIRRALQFSGVWFTSILAISLASPHSWSAPFQYIATILIYPFIKTEIAPISTFYHFQVFDSPPWYYGIEWAWATCQWYLLGLAAYGVCIPFFRKAWAWTFPLLPLTLIWCVFAFSTIAPRHDEVRQFVSLFVILSFWATIGLVTIIHYFSSNLLKAALPVLIISHLAIEIIDASPHFLSYFTGQYGGIRMAEKRGLDISMYMEVLSPKILDQLNSILPPNSRVCTAPYWNQNLLIYQDVNLLRKDLRIHLCPTDDIKNNDFDFLLATRRLAGSSFLNYGKGITILEWKLDGVSLVRLAGSRRDLVDSTRAKILRTKGFTN